MRAPWYELNANTRHYVSITLALLLWAGCSLVLRSYLPLDETRYVSVAWEMWQRHDFLVPYLNGEPYSHKPPLLFWLIHLGWVVFGVNDWSPRLIPTLFSLANLWLIQRIALQLWPERPELSRLAPVLLLGNCVWLFFSVALMFDIANTFFVLSGVLGLLHMQHTFSRGCLLFGLSIAGGLLTKGPAILLLLLPTAILLPCLGRCQKSWRSWMLQLCCAVLMGIVLALLWAIPATLLGGEEYRQAIFWGQTAHRLVHAFAHQRPFYWYALVTPLLLTPWIFWGRVWRGLSHCSSLRQEWGGQVLLIWIIPVFVAFSLVSGKQVHYLLPILPACALLVARLLHAVPEYIPASKLEMAMISLSGIVLAMLLFLAPNYATHHPAALWLQRIPPWPGYVIVATSIALVMCAVADVMKQAWRICGYSMALMLFAYLVTVHGGEDAYDVRPVSAELYRLQQSGVPVAYVGDYHGTFNFLGRLSRAPVEITFEQADNWLHHNPEGYVVTVLSKQQAKLPFQATFRQPYRGSVMVVLSAAQWRGILNQYTSARHQHRRV